MNRMPSRWILVTHRTLVLRRFPLALVCLLLAALSTLTPIQAQENDLILRVSRDWGYSGFSGDIQGNFSFHVEGPADTVKVEFYIDDQLIGTDTEAPWRYPFQTDDYPLGPHQMKAIGHTASDATLVSNVVTYTFVTAGQSSEVVLRIVVPILAFVALVFLAGTYIEIRRSKKRTGSVNGRWGVALCPKCGQPFAMHLFALNLGTRKYDRCSQCGKWSVVRRASPAQLAAYKAAAHDSNVDMASADDATSRQRRRLEDSRYEDV